MKIATIVLSLSTALLVHAKESWAEESPSAPAPPSATDGTPQPVAPPPAPMPTMIPANAHADFKEPGRFGLVTGVTDDGLQAGVARIGEHYEIVLTADGSVVDVKHSSPGTLAAGDVGLTLRAGGRLALGGLNYGTAGVLAATSLFGRDQGVSTEGSIAVGPYVGFERPFAGSPLVLGAYVLPYEFRRDVGNNGAGQSQVVISHAFFQGGGITLTYLLGR